MNPGGLIPLLQLHSHLSTAGALASLSLLPLLLQYGLAGEGSPIICSVLLLSFFGRPPCSAHHHPLPPSLFPELRSRAVASH